MTCFHSRSCCGAEGGGIEDSESRKGTWRTLTVKGMLGEDGQAWGETEDEVRGEQSEEEDEDEEEEEEETDVALSCRLSPYRLLLQKYWVEKRVCEFKTSRQEKE